MKTMYFFCAKFVSLLTLFFLNKMTTNNFDTSPTSATSPQHEFPDQGNKWKERNDRQLRLWGKHQI